MLNNTKQYFKLSNIFDKQP